MVGVLCCGGILVLLCVGVLEGQRYRRLERRSGNLNEERVDRHGRRERLEGRTVYGISRQCIAWRFWRVVLYVFIARGHRWALLMHYIGSRHKPVCLQRLMIPGDAQPGYYGPGITVALLQMNAIHDLVGPFFLEDCYLLPDYCLQK